MTAWNIAPALADAEMDELLIQFSLADPSGLAPAHEEWTPTSDLNAAAAAAWLIKAGRSSSTTETEPDSTHVTSKILDNCMKMARVYKAKGSSSMKTSR